jgi:prefoldin subunit 5
MFGKKQYKALVAAYNILDDELSSLESQLKTLRRDKK